MTRFYIASDYELMIDIFKGEINFLKSSWQNMLGRPLVVMPVKSGHLGKHKIKNRMCKYALRNNYKKKKVLSCININLINDFFFSFFLYFVMLLLNLTKLITKY